MNLKSLITASSIIATVIVMTAAYIISKDPSLPTILATILLCAAIPFLLIGVKSETAALASVIITLVGGLISFAASFVEKTEDSFLSQERFSMANRLYNVCPRTEKDQIDNMLKACGMQPNINAQELLVEGSKAIHFGPAVSLIDSATKEASTPLSDCEKAYIELEESCPVAVEALSKN